MATDGQWQQLSRELERAMMLTQRELELKNERLQILENLKRLKEEKLRLLSDNQWAESDYADCNDEPPTAPPIATDKEILRVYWAGGDSPDARLRHVYDLGRQHGAAANSKPTPNFAQISSSADTGLLPMIVSETGSDDEAETERIICSAISGGADYVNGMPRELSLERTRYGLHIGSLRTSARYVQAPLEVAMPTPAPAVGLVERLTKVFNEGLRLRRYAATDVIEAVADWLEQQQEVPIGSTASADYFAAMLRSEAGR